SVHPSLAGGINVHQALFGAKALSYKTPPWADGNNQYNLGGHVEPLQLPVEYSPPEGVKLHRSQGVVAWTGSLERDPRPDSAFTELCNRSPLTFVASETSSVVDTSLTQFSGLPVREALRVNRAVYRPIITKLAQVKGPRLPGGRYDIMVW